MLKEKTQEILEKIGLNNQESKTYLTLLSLKESKTGPLCKETEIPSSNIYKILDNLIAKGLVSYRVQNNIKIYIASNPESLNNLFLEKQKELENERLKIKELITHLKITKPEEEPYSNYKYFEGLLGIKSMWNEINEKINSNHIIKIHTSKKTGYEKLIDFYDLHHNLRKQKKIKELLIFPKEDTKLAKKRADKYTEVRFADLDNDAEWGIFQDYYFIQYIIGKNPRSFLIKDEIFAKTMEQAFDSLWNQAKK